MLTLLEIEFASLNLIWSCTLHIPNQSSKSCSNTNRKQRKTKIIKSLHRYSCRLRLTRFWGGWLTLYNYVCSIRDKFCKFELDFLFYIADIKSIIKSCWKTNKKQETNFVEFLPRYGWKTEITKILKIFSPLVAPLNELRF